MVSRELQEMLPWNSWPVTSEVEPNRPRRMGASVKSMMRTRGLGVVG
jgi:hypothetical protein